MSSAAINIGEHVYFQIMVFSRYMPRSGIAGLYDNSTFSFLKATVGGFPFFPTPSLPFICRLFNDGHSDQWKVAPHCSFDYISLIISDVEHFFFQCACWLSVFHL